MSKTIILTGGGTAGHIMPNLALLPEIEKHFDKIYYFGQKDSMEEDIIKKYSEIIFVPITSTKLVRKFTIKNLLIPLKLLKSICNTKKIIKKINPNIIFSKGGFVSVPVAIAGKKCGVPVVTHESDMSMGLANKIISHYASTVCTSFDCTGKNNPKCICTGSPIREQIFKGNSSNIKTKFKYDSSKDTILFFGGSLGSKKINKALENAVTDLTKQYNILHITGKGNSTNIKISNYYQVEFTSQIEDFFALADYVVCRGGANSIFEILALKKPMLIIPLSKAESRGDQIENANYFKNHGFAEVLEEENLNKQNLIQSIEIMKKSRLALTTKANDFQSTNSNKKIVDILIKQAKLN